MEDRDLNNRPEREKGKNTFLKTASILGISFFLSVLTVLLINL